MRQLITTLIVLVLFTIVSEQNSAQAQKWSLRQAVNYAQQHNLTIQQSVLNQRLAKYALVQGRMSQLPNVNASTVYGRGFGRSVDPTTNQFVNSDYDFMSLSGNTDVLLFGWFRTRTNIAKNKYSLRAAEADLQQIQDDISLNVATGYLRILLAGEQVGVNRKQVEVSKAQLDQTRKFAAAGSVPELNVAQLEAQLSGDSANLIQALSDYNSAIIDMKALLNLDLEMPFDIEIPVIDLNANTLSADASPEDIYREAVKHLGSIQSSNMKLKAAHKNYQSAKGWLFPQLGLNGQFGTNWASTFKEVTGFTITGSQESMYRAYIPGLSSGNYSELFPVYQPVVEYTTKDVPVRKQFDNNFRQIVSLSLNIPLFNGWQSQYAVRQAKISMLSAELNKYQAELKLKQDVYKAYNDARNSLQKYYAARRAADAAQRAFSFAEKRYDLGLTNTVEYLTTQNTLYTAESRLAGAKYDLVFKLKVIDYYLGKEIEL
jgi:outer membrane protein